jgi:TolB-like protein
MFAAPSTIATVFAGGCGALVATVGCTYSSGRTQLVVPGPPRRAARRRPLDHLHLARPHWSFTRGVADAYTRPVRMDRIKLSMPIEGGDAADAGGADRLSVDILGTFAASFRGRSVDISVRKAQAILVFLLFQKVPQIPRERLLGLLWSTASEHNARLSLRQCVFELKRAFDAIGCPYFHADVLTVGLDAAALDVDLRRIFADVHAGKVPSRLLEQDRITDQLLAGLDDVDPEFGKWLQETREAVHTSLGDMLEKLLPLGASVEIRQDAETAARALSRLAPGNELAARTLIKARVAAGDTGTAFSIYAALYHRLDKDFEIEPSEQTQALIARIRMEQPAVCVPPELAAIEVQRLANTVTGNDARPSIAVLPFRTGSPNVESYFTAGIVDNVIHVLSSFKELFVISRSSTLSYRDAAPDLRAIGRELGVRYILHGTVQRAGGKLRIQTELVDAERGEVVRTLQHNGAVADLFELQDQLAIDVVKAIAPYIRDRELKRAMQKRPDDLDAYQLTLIGYDQMFKPDYTIFVTALTNFERAHVLSPTWAPPLSYSAIWHMQRLARGWSADAPSDLEKAGQLAEQALERDAADSLANAVSGYTLSQCRHDHVGALERLNRTIELTPNLALAFAYRAAVHFRLERYDASLLDAAINLRLSPMDRHAWFGEMIAAQAYFALGNLSAAIERAKRVAAILPSDRPNLRILVAALIENDQLGEARTFASPLSKADEIELNWIARSPWPKPVLLRIEAALSRLAN